MKLMSMLVLVAAIAMVAAVPLEADAQGTYEPCSLLTASEIEAVLGTKISRTREQGTLKKPDVANCSWLTGSPKVLAMIKINRVLAGARIQNKDYVQQYKQLGWTVQVADDTTALWCGRLMPPATESTLGPSARCSTVTKGFYFDLDVFSPTATAQQVKALVDKIAARLPS